MAQDEAIKNALRLARNSGAKDKPLSEDQKMQRFQELLQGFKPEVGSPGYWADRDRTYSKPMDQRQGPEDPQRYISPEEYRKGYIGRKEYVMAKGGRAGYATGGTSAPLTSASTSSANRPTATSILNALNPTTSTATTTPVIEPSVSNYVTSVYQSLTGQAPSSSVLNSLATDLMAGYIGTNDVVQNAATSSLFQDRYKNDPSSAALSLVQTVYGRAPNTADTKYWGNTAKKQPLETLLNNLTNTREAQNTAATYDLYRDYTGSMPTTAQLAQAKDAFQRSDNYDNFIRKAFPVQTPTAGTQIAANDLQWLNTSAQTLGKKLGNYANQVYQNVVSDADIRNALPGLIGQESSGARDPYRALAKTSSAAGLFQFIDGTWISQFAKTFGDQLGLTAKEKQEWQNFKRSKATPLQKAVLGLRTDNSEYGQAINMAMGAAFNKANADKLRAAGLPVTPANVYSVHLTGDVKLAREAAKNPNAPISQGMDRKQLRANSSYQGKTVGQVMNMIGNFFTPEQGKVQKGQRIIDDYANKVRNFNWGVTPIVDPALVNPQGGSNGTTPVQGTTPVPATGPGTVVPGTQWTPPSNTQSGLTPAEILAAQGAGVAGAVGPVGFQGAGGGGFTGVSPGTSGSGMPQIYQPAPLPTFNPPPILPPSTSYAGGGFGGGFGGGGSFGGGSVGSGGFGLQFGAKNGGSIIAPDEEDVENALRLARRKGGRINTKIDKDPAFDMSLKQGGGAWTRKEGKNPEGGLNAKGRASAKAEGHNLKPPAPHPKTDKDAARRKSFCARMKGMKEKLTSSETKNDPDSRINKSLRVWNCHSDGGAVDNALRIAKGGEVWDKPRPKNLDEPESLSKNQKKSAKASAKSAGRPYPNLVDNMRAAQRKK